MQNVTMWSRSHFQISDLQSYSPITSSDSMADASTESNGKDIITESLRLTYQKQKSKKKY